MALGDSAFCPDCQTTSEVITWLQQREPTILEKKAHLVVNAQKCAIYLTDPSETVPLYWIHCRGKLPVRTEERSTQAATIDAMNKQGDIRHIPESH
ncbi:hypothetical protein KSX_05820 [Ktedonospora formicarum]|uniref:Uncharacterized protein n=1 Tax=Ktedonospora formicarum TaxID=2778364 RepID=A0A8J3HRS1_9CHLR|nr:hypothetical protein KSX_05820 [Ktedonospora formicarum]